MGFDARLLYEVAHYYEPGKTQEEIAAAPRVSCTGIEGDEAGARGWYRGNCLFLPPLIRRHPR